ncbi:nucleophosmin isoform X3 [Protopterus annectens]|uniref:nucleophosmin isoform X3 n=1 Tax=Protopterus annectens TaxID=7888 RepID=UPI001CFB1A76|nr:nucleophosmin isoform X3 [Protopterus annectens]
MEQESFMTDISCASRSSVDPTRSMFKANILVDLWGCELKADKKEYLFSVEDDESEHHLSLRTVSLGPGAKDELHVVEAEGLSYDDQTVKVILATLKMSVQPTVSLGGFDITPPLTLRLKSGSGPVYISGQHIVSLEDDMDDDEDDEDEAVENSTKPAAKRTAPSSAPKPPQKKQKLEEEVEEEEEEDEEEDEEDEDEEDEEDEDDEDEEESEEDEDEDEPVVVKKTPLKGTPAQKGLQSQNGKALKGATPKVQKTPDSGKKEGGKPATPKTPKGPMSIEEIKAKMQGVTLPKIEAKFINFVKHGFRTEDQKIIQELWKWRQSLKDAK